MFDLLRTGLRIVFVSAGGVRDYGGIKLFAEFAAHFGDAALCIFGKLLRCRAILNGIDRLARVIFKITEHAFQLLFHFFNFRLLLFLAFGCETRFLAFKFLFPGAQTKAFGFCLA